MTDVADTSLNPAPSFVKQAHQRHPAPGACPSVPAGPTSGPNIATENAGCVEAGSVAGQAVRTGRHNPDDLP
jgi:hypothetical protein